MPEERRAARGATLQPMQIDVWSDIACPWCWIGKQHLDRALAEFEGDAEVRWQPFELDPRPRTTPTSVDYVERLATKYGTTPTEARAFLDRMRAAGDASGVEIRFDRIRPANTFDAHRLLAWAASSGSQGALKERLFLAYMHEGRDVNDPTELVAISGDVGLDADRAAEVLASEEFADAVRGAQARARSRGVQGVPYLALESGAAFSGAQPPEVLLDALRAAPVAGDQPGP